MTSEARRGIAYIAGRIVSDRGSSAVYDFEASSFTSMSGDVSATNVNVYDFDRGCHIGGSPSSLYDFGRGEHVQLEVDGETFSGYDFGSGSHFNGTVSGTSISFYDFETSTFYNYSI